MRAIIAILLVASSAYGALAPHRFPDSVFESVREGNADSLRTLLKRGVGVLGERDANGNTALHIACQERQVAVVRALLGVRCEER